VVADGGGIRWRRGRARAEPEEGDDRWGPPVSRARRGVKAARGEAFSREGGGNRVGCHRRATGWAEMAGWAGERPRPSGERESGRWEKEKGSGPQLGRKPELGPIQVIKSF
jgi:hypothetical protein